MAVDRPISGSRSLSSGGCGPRGIDDAGADSARFTTETSSLRSNGFGRYSKAPLSDAWYEIQAVLVGHDDVGDDELAFAFLDPLPKRCGRAGAAHGMTLPPQR